MISIFEKEAIGVEFRSSSHKATFCFLDILVQGNYYRRTCFVTRSTCTTRLVTHSTRLTTGSTRNSRLPTRSTRLLTRSTCLSTRSTHVSIGLRICSTRLSTCSICLSNRSTRSTTCRPFYYWSTSLPLTAVTFYRNQGSTV